MTTVALLTFGADQYGDGQDWAFDDDAGGISGLWNVLPRPNNFDRNHADGSVKGPAFKSPIAVSIPLFTGKDIDPTECMDLVDALVAAWQPLIGATVATLELELLGRTYSMVGAPEGVTVDLSLLKSGLARALCTFTVHDAVVTIDGGS